ncbi:hypothetical protein Zmor_009299 [Zophobas morio]|uniref:Uncharacterized protein n=1 Tax=Zophobas morio TaxID=2755281 RepID=A0AA38MIK2_9CUCU|nr:hypothetical protein Zmor_009299 [Zophobas morio]
MYRNYSGALDCLHWMNEIHYPRSPLFKPIVSDRDPSRTSIATPLRDSPGRRFETLQTCLYAPASRPSTAMIHPSAPCVRPEGSRPP